MKKLGLIGGTGYESTLVYYKAINQLVAKRTNGAVFPEIAIESVNLSKVLDLVGSKRYDELEDYLWQRIENLIHSGCDEIALTSITVHIVFDRLKKRMDNSARIPLSVCRRWLAARRVNMVGVVHCCSVRFSRCGKFFSRKSLKNRVLKSLCPMRQLWKLFRESSPTSWNSAS